MEKIALNDNWRCWPAGEEHEAVSVTLPHDAMLGDRRSASSPGGVNTGWYEARDYVYTRTLTIPEEDRSRRLLLEFEGVYHRAVIYLNGQKIAEHRYGYTGFFADPTPALRYGAANELRVEAANRDQPNCRWYTGTGIYRPVWLLRMPKEHILPSGIRITPTGWCPPAVRVEVRTSAPGPVRVELLDGRTLLARSDGMAERQADGTGRCSGDFSLPGAELWSPEHPRRYTCRVTFGEDVRSEPFGIRVVTCDSHSGFCINGERVILRGACIHHDNGLLGAAAWDFAEERKIRLLRESGYNAIRSAHNPCSKALLEACDRLGMLVMDEYVDVWYIHKTRYDYAGEVERRYPEDLRAMVEKDYNHPSVVLYSTGNEVSETAQRRGIDLCGAMTECLHRLDGTRPVTCGVNIFFNFLSSLGFGVYSDKKAEEAARPGGRKRAVGSTFFNNMAGLFGSGFMKCGATLPPCDWKTRDAFAKMDIAGYNYGIRRYRHDLKRYPDRLIVGSETFCADAARFWDAAQGEPRLIGDFVWAGMDYLGEVGIGSWEYRDYAPDFSHGPGWLSAGSGRIDLTGRPLAEMRYTRVAFGLETVGLAVVPVPYTRQRHSPSAWKMSNAVESWSWHGCEGAPAVIEVYARAARVSLFLNGTCLGTRRVGRDCRVRFGTVYRPGTLRAVAYDGAGREIGRAELRSAGEETVLTLRPEQARVPRAGGLCYIRMQYTDRNGVLQPMARGEIRVRVAGGRLLGLGSACPYYPRGYRGDTADTYYGEALAIVLPGEGERVTLTAESPYGAARTEVEVYEA